MTDQLRSALTMVDQVDAVLALALPEQRRSSSARRAVMYAEAIDDDDEGDGLFRFGPRLLTSLQALGLALGADAPLLSPPAIGRLRPVERPRHLSAVPLRLAA